VTNADGSVAGFGAVETYRYDQESSSWFFYSSSSTDQSGYYALSLNQGTYRLKYYDSNFSEFEFYLDANTVETAKDVIITAGTDRTIDVIIGAPDIIPEIQFSLDIDGDGSVAPLTDGLLVLRSLFGFSGDALVNGAVGGNAIRTSATDIQDYIQAGKDNEALDIDADSSIAPLTDGLLILRKLFGFSGDALISGATGGNASRSTANDIDAYLQTLTP